MLLFSFWQIGALAGLGLAVLGTVLAWVRVSDGLVDSTASAWSNDARFRLADWLSSGLPVDAVVIVVLSLIGAYVIASELIDGATRMRYVVPVIGTLLAILGILNWLFIDTRGTDFPRLGVSIGLGLYVLIAGGLIAAACGLVDEFQRETALPKPNAEPTSSPGPQR